MDRGRGATRALQQPGTNSTRTASLRSEDVKGRSYQEKEPQVEQAALREAMTLDRRLWPTPISLSSLLTLPSSAGVLYWKPEAKRFLLRQSLRSGSLGRVQGIEGWRVDLKDNWELLNIFPLPHTFSFLEHIKSNPDIK